MYEIRAQVDAPAGGPDTHGTHFSCLFPTHTYELMGIPWELFTEDRKHRLGVWMELQCGLAPGRSG